MEHAFWHERWETGRIAFHEGSVNALLQTHVGVLPSGGRIFVPLCGKAVDLSWLAAHGFEIVGAELDRRAVEALFAENQLLPEVQPLGALTRYTAAGFTIYQGDIFSLSADRLGRVDAIFDRAALVALPPAMRRSYARHLTDLTGNAPQLLITYEYSDPAMQGPPHSVPSTEVAGHYEATYGIAELERRAISGPLRNRTDGFEIAWHLTPR